MKLKSEVQQLQNTSDTHKEYSLFMKNKVTQISKKIEFMWKGYEIESDEETEVWQEEETCVEASKDHSKTNNDTVEVHYQTVLNPSDGFTCSYCAFVARNKSGLKKHKKSKHTNK